MDRPNAFQEETAPAGVITKRRLGRRRHNKNEDNEHDDDNNFISKNLEAERRRREKLHTRLLALRSHVPIITNMNKASILDDAITYIRELQMKVEILTEELRELEASAVEEEMKRKPEVIDFGEEMKNYGIGEEVQVTKIGESKYWLKIIAQKKSGFFSKLMEAMNFIGFEIVDVSVTSCNGAILFLSSVQGTCGGSADVEQARDLLMEVMRNT